MLNSPLLPTFGATTMKYLWIALLSFNSFGLAQADPPFTASAQLVTNAMIQGRTAQGFAGNGRSRFQAVAVPYRLQGDDCIRIGLIRTASGSIENWQYCHGTLERLPGVSPLLTPMENPQVADVVARVRQRAAQSGRAFEALGDYQILARRIGETGEDGCQEVESIVLTDGLLLSRTPSSVCAGQREGAATPAQQ